MNRLEKKYKKEIRQQLIKELKLENEHQCPKIEKVVVAMGIGSAVSNKKDMEGARKDLEIICGQKSVVCKARKSIAAFKIRQGDEIGAKVTLRGDRMYQFLDKLLSLVLPRVRDFQGLPLKSFDGQGNYSIGIKEQIVFLEIEFGKIDKVRGLQITIITSTQDDNVAKLLLEKIGTPFAKN